MQIVCFIIIFPTLKQWLSIKQFIAVLSYALLKPMARFVFFRQYAAPLLDDLIKVLSPTLKTNSTIYESLDFSSS